MSHVAKVDVKMTDAKALETACRRIGANFCGKGFVKFYDETEVGGYVINIPGWKYNICVQSDGTVAYDNYEGEWGDISALNQLKQYYAVEVAKQEAVEQGYTYQEEELPTGVLKVTIEI